MRSTYRLDGEVDGGWMVSQYLSGENIWQVVAVYPTEERARQVVEDHNAEGPQVGNRARLLRDVERFPHFTARAGSTGTITYVSEDEVHVRMDDVVDGAEAWDNEVHWYPADGDDLPEDVMWWD